MHVPFFLVKQQQHICKGLLLAFAYYWFEMKHASCRKKMHVVYLYDLNQFPLLYLDFCSLIRANDELIVCKTLKFRIRSILFSHTRLTDLVWVISIPHEKGVSSETGDKSRHRQNLQKNVVSVCQFLYSTGSDSFMWKLKFKGVFEPAI